jgi:hypothetical protein
MILDALLREEYLRDSSRDELGNTFNLYSKVCCGVPWFGSRAHAP